MECDAQAVLRDAAERYLRVQSYRDRGEVVTRYLGSHGHTRIFEFETLFRRPDRLRFEFRERDVGPQAEWKRYQIAWCGGAADIHWTLNGRRESESIGLAIAGATGVSAGSAHTVPRLLLPPEIGGRSVLESSSARLLDPDFLDRRPHHKLLVVETPTRRETVWLDAESLLISRIDEWHWDDGKVDIDTEYIEHLEPAKRERLLRTLTERTDSDPYEVHETTTYHYWIDKDIDDDEFTLDLPDA